MRVLYGNEILKPPQAVFPWLAEPAKAMRWQRNVKGTEITANPPGVVGTTFTEVIEEDGNRLEMRGVITGFVRDRSIAFHLESKMHRVDVSYSLEGAGGTTRLTVDARIDWKFPINLLSIFLGGRMKTGITEQLKTEILELKKICESG